MAVTLKPYKVSADLKAKAPAECVRPIAKIDKTEKTSKTKSVHETV